MINPAVVDVEFNLGALPSNLDATPEEFLRIAFARTKATIDLSGFLIGQIGGDRPTTNKGLYIPDSGGFEFWNDTDHVYKPMVNELEIGDLVMTARDTCDSNRFLYCDGRAVSRQTYADLFAAIGTRYGIGDGTTTFNLPNSPGRVPIGVGVGTNPDGSALTQHQLGEVGGQEMVALTGDQIPKPQTVSATTGGTNARAVQVFNEFTTSGSPHNNMMPWFAIGFKIKYR